ncbi:hypothetical protein A4X06_0g7319 [Tilletia controversa]|uniref:Uncharacterized protein n=1 Tax=Tilletia controversa TaxID=13291 RepID=A0A8X7MM98_9BASI|nr:hypothetical protein A4X06_0g7319 [Tilletia controversa]
MLNPTSFVRLLVTAAAVLPLTVTALPGVDPVSNRRGGAKLSSYHGNNSTSTPILVRDASAGGACNTAADCGSDAPMCEFPWVFEPSPYNQPQRVCMLSINYQGCNSDSQCTTHNCITGADQPICFPDDGGCTANSCPQIPTTDMRCSNGVSLEGFCLIAGNNPCTESAECSSGTCQANNFCAKDNVLGLPAPNDYTCGSNFRPTSFSYVASTELADGSFAISPIFYNYRYCGWNDQNAICSQNSECKSGLCLVSAYNDGEKRCGMGADIGKLCLRDADCHSQRCAHTKGVSHTSCTYQPVGGGCSMPSQCGSNKCTYSKCQAVDVGGKCYYSSDCSTSNCSNGICGFLGATTTTTATTATTTTASTASVPSTTDSTATSTSSSATSTSTSTTTLTSTGSTTTAASTSTSTSTSTTSMSTSTSTSTTTTTTPKLSTTTTSVSTASTSKPSSSTTSTTSKATGSSTGTTTTSKSSTSSTTSKSSTTSTSSKPISTTAPSTSIKPSTTTRSSTVISTSSTSKSTATASRSTTTTSKSTSTTSKSTITTSKSTITTSKSATTTSKPTTTTSVKPLPSGAPCSVNTICQSGYCRAKLNPDGTRASQAYCDTKKTGGAACYQNAGCLSGSCIIAKGASSGSCK